MLPTPARLQQGWLIDETFAYIHAVKYAKDQDLDLNTVLAQQSLRQAVILDFYQIRPVLSACLQLPLYNLYMPAVMTPNYLMGYMAF